LALILVERMAALAFEESSRTSRDQAAIASKRGSDSREERRARGVAGVGTSELAGRRKAFEVVMVLGLGGENGLRPAKPSV